jgi:uncharacterized membrane protein
MVSHPHDLLQPAPFATRLRWIPIIGISLLRLLFLPNAPYLVTDIIHLRPHRDAPLWYDLITLVAFAWTGSFLGLVSLFLMQILGAPPVHRHGEQQRLPAPTVSFRRAVWIFIVSMSRQPDTVGEFKK